MRFIGRKEELNELKNLFSKRSASLIVIKGRRRIGKSRLLLEYSKLFDKAYIFSGLAPTQYNTAESQRIEFGKQFARQFNYDLDHDRDWGDIFWELSKKTKQGRVLIVFDEISWMGSKDPEFLGQLKHAWDLYFQKNDQLILAICGSASAWIEKNILSSTGFLGRESLSLTVNEMPLKDCVEFWGKKNQIAAHEKIKMLSIMGGIPRYLENIRPELSAEENIRLLCFTPSGILFNEFEKIFSDLFSVRHQHYKEIVECLADGIADQKTILDRLGLKKGGDISEYLNDLIQAGFISRDYSWRINSGKISNLSHYRLKDNYARFYLKYILPNRSKIEQGNMKNTSLSNLRGWYSIMGLQVENLILSNRQLIKQALRIDNNDIICDNPFFQRKNTKQLGCQIDYLIQTKYNTIYLCEIKYSTKPIGVDVIDEMNEKIKRLKIPRNSSLRPVLIHLNGVSESLEEQQYFSNIIDFSDFLQQ